MSTPFARIKSFGAGVRDALMSCAREPHRVFFAAGIMAALFMSVWWALALGSVSAYPPVMVHAVLMPLGVFPLFMLGFIFTAGPRWLQVGGPEHHARLALVYLLGLMCALAGFALGEAWPAPGLAMMLGAWLAATARWLKCVRDSRAEDRRHGVRLLVAMLGGSMALATTLAWVLTSTRDLAAAGVLWSWARQLSLWAFIVPVFLIVCHRMIPFFTASALPHVRAWRPFGLLDGWILACAVLASGVPADVALPWSRIQAVVAIAMAISLGVTSWRWNLVAASSNRLLFMLHLSFAWLPVALALQAMGLSGFAVGSAPSHAIALGFCVTMLIAFVTRVSLGHSGRPLVADNGYWAIYLALHVVAALRVLIALAGLAMVWLHVISALWALLMMAWAARVLPIYWRGRIDAKA